ncbi:tubulin polyglutamylase TTLL11 isoform X5 [Arvicanthis niloticus]|uniref:tubulin polyglutamylase TTLL11 isoform X5 n=1 Tax=Arvicanthis niloticus TaxID=61156 RepID=UPI00402B8EFF
MSRNSPEREPAAGWEVDAAAAATESLAAEAGEQLGVDAGAAGEPERPEREEQPKAVGRAPSPAPRRAPEEGDARVVRRLPPAPPLVPPRPAARALSQLVKARGRSRGRGSRRSSGSVRPVTVDSSKARTSLDALKISLRQLRWKEVQTVKDGDPSWRPTFIVKPDSGCQGDGIYLIKDPCDGRLTGTLHNRPAVVQEYIRKPLLIDKLKFDIRLYVLLKSLDPLEIYIAKDGLSRFCTEPYQEPNPQNLHHVFMHLTNYSLNIHSGKFVHSDSASTGSKRTFSSILCRLSSKGVDIKKVWSDIISLVIKTVIALTPELKVFYQSDIPTGRPGPTCFQILGFDIILMKNLKPMLLEVNANPSMRIEHEYELSPGVFENIPSLVDEEVKVAVIRDTLRLMDPLKKKKEIHFPDIYMDRKHRIPPVSDRMSSWKHKGSSLSIVRSQQVEKPFTSKEDINCELAGDSDSPEAHLPSICLKQVFPKYAKQFNYLRLVDRMANLFIRFLGIKGTMKLGPTGFRTFIRNCKLSSSSLSMAAVDILYIDITRRWNSVTLDQRDTGMCLQAFVEAFFFLAQRKFKLQPLHEQVASLIDLCEYHLSLLDEKRLCRRGRPHQRNPPQMNREAQSAAGSSAPQIIGASKLSHS